MFTVALRCDQQKYCLEKATTICVLDLLSLTLRIVCEMKTMKDLRDTYPTCLRRDHNSPRQFVANVEAACGPHERHCLEFLGGDLRPITGKAQ